jgi:hypothetical protein
MEEWSLLSFTFRWPHQGIIVGYELLNPSEEADYSTVRLHILLISINYDFGYGEPPY